MRVPFIAGNWKMFKTIASAKVFADEFKDLKVNKEIKVAICAPYTQLAALVEAFKDTEIGVGAQNVHYEAEGAFTGEISLPMLKEIGVDYCIIGHSERREYFNETDEAVNKKVKMLLEDDSITPILCVGESLEVREAGEEASFVEEQIEKDFAGISADKAGNVVIAYEPVWAIGTGKTATPDQADSMCKTIREKIKALYDESVSESIIIQYGGSVKPANSKEILTMGDIDGALVGGASLKSEDFKGIINF